MDTDARFAQEEGGEIFTGNELVVKGALETEGGVHLLTGYPGPPVADFFDVLRRLAPRLAQKGVVARLAGNEAMSVAMVNGAQVAGCRAMAVVASDGLQAAADSLALGMSPQGRASGGVIVCGDDPWGHSTQTLTDSRFLADQVRMTGA